MFINNFALSAKPLNLQIDNFESGKKARYIAAQCQAAFFSPDPKINGKCRETKLFLN
jgi:hypothetical protein